LDVSPRKPLARKALINVIIALVIALIGVWLMP
jgi:hypothetical protein